MDRDKEIIKKIKETLIEAASSFNEDKKCAYQRAINAETNEQAKWVLESILKNAEVAEKNHSPLCDDTGIPHVLIEVGPKKEISGQVLQLIQEGIACGLRELPGRPMAVRGDDTTRLAQADGMYNDPGMLFAAPYAIRNVEEDVLRVHILMFGGGPAIRGKTYRVFHKHDANNVVNEIIEWAKEAVSLLGCTPCTLGVGIGRSQYEASTLMLQALVDGLYSNQSDIEKMITEKVNEASVGALGLGGATSVLGTFLRIGEQRASGVRVVCLRPCCCMEPRISSVEL